MSSKACGELVSVGAKVSMAVAHDVHARRQNGNARNCAVVNVKNKH